MKNKIFTVCFLIFVFSVFSILQIKNNGTSKHKILKVIEADKFYIDFNDNGKIENDELSLLKNVKAFTPVKNSFTEKQAQNIRVPLEYYLENGLLARSWAQDNLEGKEIYVKSKLRKNDFFLVEILFNDEDLGEILLSYGLAHIYDRCNNANYFQLQNIKQAKLNSNEISKLKFLLLNSKSAVIHKLNCEFAHILSHGELIIDNSKADIFHRCKYCFSRKNLNIQEFNFPLSNRTYKKSVYKNFGALEMYLINPLEYKLPSTTCANAICSRVVKEINSAKESIDMALYGVGEQKEIISALINAKKRGIKIRAVFDYSKNIDEIYPYTAFLSKQFETSFSKAEALMHNKFLIFDGKKVLTGSMNISPTGSGGYNSNIAAIFNSAAIASFYKEEFNQMFSGKFSKSKAQIDTEPVNLGGYCAQVYFSPKHDIQNSVIIPKLKAAKNEIIVSAFYMTDFKIIDELISAKNRGVDVYVIIDALGAMNFKDRILKLRNAKIPSKVENWGGKNHEKTIVVDSRLIIFGSANFSVSGFKKNDENVVVVENSDVAKFYRDYFFYLFNKIDNKFLKAFPRAEGFESANSCNDGIDNNFDGKIDSSDDGCILKK